MVLAHDINKGDRTRDVKISQNITFETMLLAPDTLKGLKNSGFYKPSPIQLYGIPIGKCGFDLLLEAKSGTGKTAVFTIIALEKLDFRKGLQVVILTPTREIAAQICDVLKQIGSTYKQLQVEVVMGGLPVTDDIQKFKKSVHIVVGSPGRLRHLIQNKYIDIKSVRLLVLDEADKLMEGNFQADIKFIHTSLPKQKQVIMSSATYPHSSRDIISSYVQNASHVCPDSDCILLGIEQKITLVKYNNNIYRHTQDRFKELNKILTRLQFKQCLVFCNYQVRVAEINKLLKKAEWPSQKLHGMQEQVDRLDALKTLQQYKCRILVSTDLAARGIDASNIDLVINFEPPYDWQTYLHRIGRAGRYGSYGVAITILSEGKEEQKFKELFKTMELSFQMRYLWDDKQYDINSSATKTQESCNSQTHSSTNSDVVEKVPSKNMWELLSSKDNEVSPSETLETASDPKENLDIPKIEPFSDLIMSLNNENCEHADEDIVFKHIEMGKITANKSAVSRSPKNSVNEKDLITSLKNGNCEHADEDIEFKDIEMGETTANKSEVSQSLKYSVNEKDTVNKNLHESNNVNISHNSHESNNELNEISFNAFKNINENTAKTKDEHEEPNKALSNLDLPVAFSSSKHKRFDTKRKIIKTKSENRTYSDNVHNNMDLMENYIQPQLQQNAQTIAVNGDIDNYPHLYKERQTNYKNKSEKIDKYYNKTDNYYQKEYRYNDEQKENYVKAHTKKKSSQSHQVHQNQEQLKNAKLYQNWYNQLKMTMKHIEHAVYIDEMTKF